MHDREIDEVWAQLNAMAADKQSWRRYRILEICCRNCGEPIAEVMKSANGPVVVYRSFKGVTAGTVAITGKSYESQSMSKYAVRVLAGGGPFICFCGCSRTVLNEADLSGPVEAGQRRVIWRHTATGLDK
jgi:hypothetical protein